MTAPLPDHPVCIRRARKSMDSPKEDQTRSVLAVGDHSRGKKCSGMTYQQSMLKRDWQAAGCEASRRSSKKSAGAREKKIRARS